MFRDDTHQEYTKHPWINRTIRRLSHVKQRYFNRARQSNLPEHWSEYYKKSKWNPEKNAEVHITNILLIS